MKPFLLCTAAAVLLSAPQAASAQDFLGGLARRAAERLAEHAVAAVVAPRGEASPRPLAPAAAPAAGAGQTRPAGGTLDAWLQATPPVPAPGFRLVGMTFLYEDSIDDSGEDFEADGRTWPGWGESEAAPTGDRFELPRGLELVGPIKTYNPADPSDCDDKYENEALGEGELVQLCLTFRNTTSQPITLQLPPGMMFVSRSRDVQNGVLVRRVSITVPPSTVFFQPLFLHCTNSGFGPSSQEENGYDMGPVQNQQVLREFYALIENKRVDRWYFPIVAQAVTDLGDAGKISARTRRGLNALPNR